MEDIILANKELNEWCGTEGINYYEGIEALGFLFKYAVPKLPTTCDMYLSVHWEKPGYYTCTIQDIHIKGFRTIFITDTDPALALFWALYPILKEANK